MIYDCFLFFNEYDILDIRLNTLKDVVDKWIIVEGSVTHSGKPKGKRFWEQRERYAEFLDRIEYVWVEDTPDTNDNFKRQEWQRDAILRGLEKIGAKSEDHVIVSDVDEIPRPSAVLEAAKKNDCCRFKMLSFFYHLNLCSSRNWNHAYIAPYGSVKDKKPTPLRHAGLTNPIERGGWHFSYAGDENSIKEKIQSFGASDRLDKPEIIANIDTAVKERRAVWDVDKNNGTHESVFRIGYQYPQYIRDHEQEYREKGLIIDKPHVEITQVLKESNNWFTYAPFYDRVVKDYPDFKRFVEVGVWKGHSIRHLARALKDRDGVSIWAVDLFESSPIPKEDRKLEVENLAAIYEANLNDYGVRDMITDIIGYSDECAKEFEDGSLDFVFIDADHSKEAVIANLRAWIPKVKKGGIIGGHDWPHVKYAVNQFFPEVNAEDGSVWWMKIPPIDRRTM